MPVVFRWLMTLLTMSPCVHSTVVSAVTFSRSRSVSVSGAPSPSASVNSSGRRSRCASGSSVWRHRTNGLDTIRFTPDVGEGVGDALGLAVPDR